MKKGLIFISLFLVASIYAAPTVKQSQDKIIVSTKHQVVDIDLKNGGTVTGFKVDGTQLLERQVGKERLGIVRLFKPQLTRFAGEWKLLPTSSEGKTVTVSMSKEGPFFSRITKSYIFTDDKPGFTLKVKLFRRIEGMNPARYTLWVGNLINRKSNLDKLVSSSNKGPVTFEKTFAGQKFFYNPKRSYCGVFGKKIGIIMETDPKHTDAFCNWAAETGTATFEVCYRNIEIKENSSFTTKVKYIPVKSSMPPAGSGQEIKEKIGKTNEPGVREDSSSVEASLKTQYLFIAKYNKNINGESHTGAVSGKADPRNAKIVTDGRFGKSVKIKGGRGIAYPVKGNINPRKGCIEMWVKNDFPPRSKQWRFLFKMDGKKIKGSKKGTANSIHLVRSSHNQVRAAIYGSKGVLHRAYRPKVDMEQGKWYHVRMVWNLDRPVYKTQFIDLYINGSNKGNSYGLADRKFDFKLDSDKFYIGSNYIGQIDSLIISKEAKIESVKPERKIDLKAVKPYIKWFTPYIKGKTKVLFITDCYSTKDISALNNMMDLDVRAVKFVYPFAFDNNVFGIMDDGSIISNADAAVRMRHALADKYDVIVIGASSFAKHLPKDIQQSIADKVKTGTGLVLVSPHGYKKQILGELIPAQGPKRGKAFFKQYSDDKKIATGLPLKALPKVETLRTKPDKGASILLKSGKYPVLMENTFGKGKVYIFFWGGIQALRLTRFDNLHANTSLTPHTIYRKGEFKYWLKPMRRYFRLLLARTILDAAGKNSNYTISDKKSGILQISAPKAGAATLECTISTANNTWETTFNQNVKLKAGVNTIPIKVRAGIPNGRNLLDLVLKVNGKAAAGAGIVLFAKNAAGISSISDADAICKHGQSTDVKLKFSGNAKDARIIIKATDRFGRVGFSREQKVSGDTMTIKVDTSDLLPPFMRITAEMFGNNGQLYDVKTIDRFLLPAKREDFQNFRHFTWASSLDSFNIDYGLIMQRFHAKGSIFYANTGTLPIPHTWKFHAKDKEIASGKYIRIPSLNDNKYLAESDKKIQARAKNWKTYEPAMYILCDEVRFSPRTFVYWDGCFHPDSLKKFRLWLGKRYGSLKKLNTQWSSNFSSWDKVQPMTLAEAKKRKNRNYSPWADFREFGDDSFIAYVKFCGDIIRKQDSEAKVAMSGTVSPFASNGFDWWKMSKTLDVVNNYRGIQRDLLRSFAPYSDIKVGTYSAGYGFSGNVLFEKMFYALLNQNHFISSWTSKLFYNPEGSTNKPGTDTKRVVNLFKTGLWDYVRSFKREKSVAMLYSMNSLRGAFVENKWTEFRDGIQGWADILHDCFVPWAFISEEQLANGILGKEKYKALVLPWAVSLSDAEIAAINKFVKNGGVLITDGRAGIFDEHCKLRSKQFSPPKGRVTVVKDNMSTYMSDASYYKKSILTEWQKKFRGIFKKSGIPMFAKADVNSGPFHGKSAFYRGADNSYLLMALPNRKCATKDKNNVRISMQVSGNVWNPLKHSFYRKGNVIKQVIESGFPAIGVISGGKTEEASFTIHKTGNKVTYSIKVDKNGFVPTYYTVTVRNPEGQNMPYYANSLIIDAPGTKTATFSTALNDKKGSWTINFINGLTGKVISKTFIVK
jgi:Beta-galactosidase/Concanavalin A-like lectin/glucanases superfamily/Beta-galactosidase trimerisation domain